MAFKFQHNEENLARFYFQPYPLGMSVYNYITKRVGVITAHMVGRWIGGKGLWLAVAYHVTAPKTAKVSSYGANWHERNHVWAGELPEEPWEVSVINSGATGLVALSRFKHVHLGGYSSALVCTEGAFIRELDNGDHSVGIWGGSVIVGTGRLNGYYANGAPDLALAHWDDHGDNLNEGDPDLAEVYYTIRKHLGVDREIGE